MPPRSFRPHPRLALPALALLLTAALGMSCPNNVTIRIVSPADGSTVTSFSFPVEVEIGGNVDTAAAQVTLNGVPLAVVEGPAGTFTVTVDPGDPLLDDNEIVVSVPTLSGTPTYKKASTFVYGPPKASARTITSAGELLTGPLAQNRLGDTLLENDQARFVVQAPGGRDLHSVGQFGGNLIDAELVSRPGRDAFFEFQPSINIESVINAQTLEIVNDGQNGLAAVVRTCGPDDLLDYINASSQVAELGLSLPNVLAAIDDRDYDVQGCTEYRLEPGKRYVEVETTVYNNEPSDTAFYVGEYLNGMGTMEFWAPGAAKIGLGETLLSPITDFVGYFGFGDSEGVDYGFVPILWPGGFPGGSSAFTTSGVTFLLHSQALVFVLGADAPSEFTVPAGGSRSFVSYFAVGDGSLTNTAEVEAEVKGLATGGLRGCITVGGAPAPGARVVAGVVQSGAIATPVAHWVTDASGCYAGQIQPGSYSVAAMKAGVPYEGGGTTPLLHPVSVTAGGDTVQDIALPATGRLRVEVVDQDSNPMPARVSVVGIDPTPEPLIVTSVQSFQDTVTSPLNDVSRDRLVTGFVAMAFADAAGVAEFDLEPGQYQVVVSRGTEYSTYSQVVNPAAGGPTVTVNAQIAHVLDTSGFVSSDFHVHMLNSPDSRIALTTRARSFAAEGVDNIIATDHDAITDLNPTIASLGLTAFVHSTIGEEITSFDYGHYNAYPQAQDATRVTNGSTDWAREAPPGMDFPLYGAYVRTPAEIDAEAVGKAQNAGLETVVQINHIGSHFNPLQIDTALTPPQSLLPDPTIFRLDPSVPNFFHPFKALELWNGASAGKQDEFLVERLGIWMNLLNQGIVSTAIADTDTHSVLDLETAGARTWTPSSTDAPSAIVDNEIGLAVKGGRAVGGQGCYVQARLVESDTAQQADFELGGSTLVTVVNGDADLEIHVQAPTWAPYDSIEIYRNAATQVTGSTGGTPVDYTGVPTQVLSEGTDFTRTTVAVHAVPGGDRFETSVTVPLAGLTQDEWIAVFVKGTPGTAPPMYPVFPRDADGGQTLADLMTLDPSEGGVRALCFTNALFADVDGNGMFDPPGVQVVP